MKLLLRLIAGAVATAVAVWLVPGITLTASDHRTQAVTLICVSALISLVNAIVRPFAKTLGFCLIILTIGLFLLIINAFMLLLVSWLAGNLGLAFHVDGFVPALLGSIVISVVTAAVSALIIERD